ncbi:MAG: tyrosine-type recombinase/integrase [Acidimicrobiia bacterium]
MKGHKRFRSGAWRLTVFAGWDPVTGKRVDVYATVKAPDNRAGAKVADARLAELVTSVESGEHARAATSSQLGPTIIEVAEKWQRANRPRQNERTGDWVGWSPKTAKTNADNFRLYIVPTIGDRLASHVAATDLDDLYDMLETERGLSASLVRRCHSQLRAMFSWALRKKLVSANPAVAADPPRVKPAQLLVPSMSEVRKAMTVAKPSFAAYIQLAATVGARRGSMVALRWGNVDLSTGRVTFDRAIADSLDGQVEKGTKAERPYVVSIGPSSVAVLTDHRARAAEAASAVGIELTPDSFVFSDDGGRSPWNLSWPSHAWKQYALRSGLTGVRLHDLRHTAASQMLMAGVPISIVAERLGCTEANILRTYRHFIPGSDRSAAEMMDRMLDGGDDPLAS